MWSSAAVSQVHFWVVALRRVMWLVILRISALALVRQPNCANIDT
jgi:hypothetical protein|eukprot:COSAG01_NODE_2486_length_7593_cov_2.425674_3_plen_45_part_00